MSFIVLNSFYTATPAATLFTWQLGGDRNEVTRELADFYGEGAGASDTCSMVYKGQMYILGGWPDRRQVTALKSHFEFFNIFENYFLIFYKNSD